MAGRGEPFAGVPFFWTQHFDARARLRRRRPGLGRDRASTGDLAARDFTAFYAAGGALLAACGTQRAEIGAFVELMRAGRLPAAGVLRGRRRAGLPELLAEQAQAGPSRS